jgi:ankyrin repeat protein
LNILLIMSDQKSMLFDYQKFIRDSYLKDNLDSKLIFASVTNNIADVKNLLKAGADPTTSDSMSVMKSIEAELSSVIKIIIHHMVRNKSLTNILVQDYLFCAAEHGRVLVLKLIMEIVPSTLMIDLDWTSALMFSCKNGHLEMVQYLIKETPYTTFLFDQTIPLSYAADNGHVLIVQFLLDNGFKANNLLLRTSIMKNQLNIASVYIKSGVDPGDLPKSLADKLLHRKAINRPTNEYCCITLDEIQPGATYRICLSNVPHYFTYDPKYNYTECPMCRGILDFDIYLNQK